MTPRELDCAVKIGQRIKILRKAHGLTQVELAEQAGMNANYLGQVERGEITISLTKLLKLADVLGVTLGAIVEPCWVPPTIPIERIKEGLIAKLDKLSDIDVLVLDRMADYLHGSRSDNRQKKEE